MSFSRRRFVKSLVAGTLIVITASATRKAEALAAATQAITAKSVKLHSNGCVFAAYYHGDIAEIIVYDTVLSDQDRRAVEDHLARKWGLV